MNRNDIDFKNITVLESQDLTGLAQEVATAAAGATVIGAIQRGISSFQAGQAALLGLALAATQARIAYGLPVEAWAEANAHAADVNATLRMEGPADARSRAAMQAATNAVAKVRAIHTAAHG